MNGDLLQTLYADLQKATEKRAEWERWEKHLKARIFEILGYVGSDAKPEPVVIKIGETPLFRVDVVPRTAFNQRKFRTEQPGMYAQYESVNYVKYIKAPE